MVVQNVFLTLSESAASEEKFFVQERSPASSSSLQFSGSSRSANLHFLFGRYSAGSLWSLVPGLAWTLTAKKSKATSGSLDARDNRSK